MKCPGLVVLLLYSVSRCGGNIVGNDAVTDVACPPWTIPTRNNESDGSVTCTCGDGLGGVVNCDAETLKVTVLVCHCMTYNNDLNITVVGHCIINCLFLDYLYYDVNTDSKGLNHFICSKRGMARTGQMCGRCEEGYAPPAYSYNVACVECSDYKYNWLKYIAIAFLPLTAFFILVVTFKISVTSETMNAYVLISQVIAAPVQLRILTIGSGSPALKYATFWAFSSLYMLWNLDMFRGLYTPFCLHPDMSVIQMLALEYLIAIYPFLLIIITYSLVNLHDRFRVVVRLWSPFYWCLARLRREWNIRSSLIEAFATFILLSYVKILNISFDILTPTTLYDVHGNRLQDLYVYYDGTYKYFGEDHLPYAFLALVMALIFNIFPLLLLCLYPCRCFHRGLNICRLRRQVLTTFMDTFNGCYRIEPRDYRFFAAFYLVLRIINLALFSITTSPLYYPVGGFTFMVAAITVAIARPYKDSPYFIDIDVILFALLSTILFCILSFGYLAQLDPDHITRHVWYRYAYALLLLPPMYGAGLLIYRLLPKRVLLKLKAIVQYCRRNRRTMNDSDLEVLPHRLEHGDQYLPMVPFNEQVL